MKLYNNLLTGFVSPYQYTSGKTASSKDKPASFPARQAIDLQLFRAKLVCGLSVFFFR
jgi:hypothetical protein